MAKDSKYCGLISQPDPPTGREAQAPQAPEDRHAQGYDNDTPNDWRRGNGLKPGFDKHKAGR